MLALPKKRRKRFRNLLFWEVIKTYFQETAITCSTFFFFNPYMQLLSLLLSAVLTTVSLFTASSFLFCFHLNLKRFIKQFSAVICRKILLADNISPYSSRRHSKGWKTCRTFTGDFPKVGKPAVRLQETFQRLYNLPHDCRRRSIGWTTCRTFAGGFPKVGKPAARLQETFQKFDKLPHLKEDGAFQLAVSKNYLYRIHCINRVEPCS